MKKTYLSLFALFAALQFSYGQWTTSGTNIYNSNTGNVGIGINTPTNKLQIGSVGSTGYGSNAIALGDGANVVALHHGSTAYLVANGNLAVGGGTNTSNQLFLSSGGNVGIGVATPTQKFSVHGSSGVPATSGTAQNGLLAVSNADTYATLYAGAVSTPPYSLWLQGSGRNDLSMNYTVALNPNGGNVGIGTVDTKGYTLAVNGSAVATSMKVKLQANWPDFVFRKGYKLPTLTEVKAHIDKNRRLPDMPSAAEVHANGLDLGEMNRLLLKKVEELTLYAIDQEKKIETMRLQQDARIKALEAIISNK